MNADALEARLDLWGRAMGQGGRKGEQEPRSLTGNSTLANYGRPTGYKGMAEGRGGKARRALMAAQMIVKGKSTVGLRSVPMWSADPVPCTATRTYKAPDFDPRYTQEVDRIQQEWLVMYRMEPMLAAVLRIEYQTRGRQVDKAEAMSMPAKSYKDQLRMAKLWLRARLAA